MWQQQSDLLFATSQAACKVASCPDWAGRGLPQPLLPRDTTQGHELSTSFVLPFALNEADYLISLTGQKYRFSTRRFHQGIALRQ